MHAAHLSIRFMYSFVLKHSAISDIINNLDGLALARVPRPTNGFRHLLTLRRTEAVAEPALKDGTRRPATVVTLSVRYHGLSHEVGASGLPFQTWPCNVVFTLIGLAHARTFWT
jgi:hypothetical protein